ncbi:hypothetical protein DIPPA_17057 [Diplonema papillatum]|nr:hypothetical protein DIPPA_17057 [Diplonema papillatum]
MCDEGGVCLEIPRIEVTVTSEPNFIAFNRESHDLDSDWLMQPVNEAEYDSETQFCVDTKTKEAGQEKSFYAHYVTKRKKTRGKRGKKETMLDDPEPQKLSVPKRAPLTAHTAQNMVNDGLSKSAPGNGPPKCLLAVDLLSPPGMPAPPKGSLNNAATRRIACGALPPSLRGPQKPAITAADMNASSQRASPATLPLEGNNDKPSHIDPSSVPTVTTAQELEDPADLPPPSYEQASQQLKKPSKASFSSRTASPSQQRSSSGDVSPPTSPSEDKPESS